MGGGRHDRQERLLMDSSDSCDLLLKTRQVPPLRWPTVLRVGVEGGVGGEDMLIHAEDERDRKQSGVGKAERVGGGGSTLGKCDTLSVAELVVRRANATAVQVPLKDVRSHRQIARGGFQTGSRPGEPGKLHLSAATRS